MPFKPKLCFVPEIKTSESDNKALIRKHAQRQSWQRRRIDAIGRLKPNGLVLHHRKTTPDNSSYADYDDPISKTSTICGIGNGNSDPFDSAAVKINSILHNYLMFFATSMWSACSRYCQPGQFLVTFGTIAVQDGGVLYAIAASAAVRQQSRNRTLPLASGSNLRRKHELVYAALAARRIREKLNHVESSNSDLTIGLIAFLAMFEAVDNGRLDRSLMHISAIRRLIEARGGACSISWLWIERILAADTKTACVGLSRPLLPLLSTVQSARQIRSIIREQQNDLSSCFQTEAVAQFLTPFCQQFIHDLRDLVLLTQGHPSEFDKASQDTFPEFSLFLHQRLALEQALLEHIANSDMEISPFEACTHIGLLLFINTAFWIHFESSCAILLNLCWQLRQRLNRLEHEEDLLTAMEYSFAKVWLLFIGAYASRKTESYYWFVQRLRNITFHLAIYSEAVLKQVLSRGFYVETLYGEVLHNISVEIFQDETVRLVHQSPIV